MAALAIIPLAYLILFHGLGRYGLVNGDEGFRHAVAHTMLETGDYFRLDFHGEHRLYDTFMNAPLQYWAGALVISIFGDNSFSMRILSALFALASIVLTGAFARRLAGDRAGLLAAAIQLTTFQFIYWHGARTGELEAATALFFTAVAWSFVRFVETGRGVVLHHICWLLLANWKLPLGLVPLCAEAVAFALLPAARARFVPWLRAAAVVLPLGFVWHAAQLAVHWDGFLEVAHRMLAQASGQAVDAAGYSLLGNARFYFFAVLYGAFPYSLLYPFAFASLAAHAFRSTEVERTRWLLLALFVAGVFVFFLLVAKHYRWYWTPALPLLSIFAGVWLDRVAVRRPAASVVGAVALLIAGMSLIDVDLVRTNPFAARVVVLPFVLPLRSLLGMAWPAEALGFAAVGVGLALGVWHLGRGRAGALLAAGIASATLGFATMRVLLPLQYLDHRTEMARLREQIDATRARGAELPLPIAIREGGELKVRSLFARDFQIVPGGRGTSWWLFAPGDPRAVGSLRSGPPGGQQDSR